MNAESTSETGPIFRKLYITAPLGRGHNLDDLQRIGLTCSELTIGVGQVEPSPTRETPRSWRRRLSSSSRLSQPQERGPSPLWDTVRNALRRRSSVVSEDAVNAASLDISQLSPRTTREIRSSREIMAGMISMDCDISTSPVLPMPEPLTITTTADQRVVDTDAEGRAIDYWTGILACFGNINTLTFRVKGETGWPGSTNVEYVLTILRCAVERAQLPNLKRVRFQPLHAMGIVVMRWHGFGAIAQAPATAYRVWQNITRLDLQIHNPMAHLNDAQKRLFHKMLYDYLSSFAGTVKQLRFVWLDEDGPSPVALEQEAPISGIRDPIHWIKLEGLWLGNTTKLDYTVRTSIPRHAPSVRSLKTLRAGQGQTPDVFEDHMSWVEVVLPPEPLNRYGRDRASQGWWDVIDTDVHEEPRDSYLADSTRSSRDPDYI
ncbi:hypothetical protein AMS68_004433 [Peltaster fructicola]|uniref:Uncharacterized protein n=1 Tax=Peltaster fructicola TaxID=286661 RepID=A0A6H0XW57_9PEZI|nr:hypothetical protein AMS68_004433 [Peltaster fructicola]